MSFAFTHSLSPNRITDSINIDIQDHEVRCEELRVGAENIERDLIYISSNAQEQPPVPKKKRGRPKKNISKPVQRSNLKYLWGLMTSEDEPYGTNSKQSDQLISSEKELEDAKLSFGTDQEMAEDEHSYAENISSMSIDPFLHNSDDPISNRKVLNKNDKMLKHEYGSRNILANFLGLPEVQSKPLSEPPSGVKIDCNKTEFNGIVVLKIGSINARRIQPKILESTTPSLIVKLRYRPCSSFIVKLPYRPNLQISKLGRKEVESNNVQPSAVSKKPIHPFFLKRAESNVSLPSSSDTSDTDTQQSKPPKPAFLPSNFLSVTAKSTSLPTPWPTLNQMHVRGLESNGIVQRQLSHPLTTSKFKKSKRNHIYISDSENIVNLHLKTSFTESCNTERDSSSSTLSIRRPAQVRFTKAQLTDMALQVIRKESYIKILQPLLDRIETFTPFDRNEYETQMWSLKYAPTSSYSVITKGSTGCIISKWLVDKFEELKKLPNSTFSPLSLLKSRKEKKRKAACNGNEFDDFIVNETDFITSLSSSPPAAEPEHPPFPNFLILCGPSGSGKTSSVYAAAAELGAYTFELNPSDKRSSKKLFEKLGGMGKSHLVHRNTQAGLQDPDFKQKSVILLDEVDILFDEEQSFWPGLDKFVETSRRPVVMTCSDPSLLPPTLIENHPECFVYFNHAALSLQIDALWLIALCEGHIVDHRALKQLVLSNKYDFRSCINDLQFWCQMGLGGPRSGISWILTHKERVQTHQQNIRVISNGTYIGKDWYQEGDPISTDELSESSFKELDFTVTPSAKCNLSDWCSFADSLSDADYLSAKKCTQLATNVEEEYSRDRLLGLQELDELPNPVLPYSHELAIYPSIVEKACHLHASRFQDQPISKNRVGQQDLRDSLWFLSSRTTDVSSAPYNCVETSSCRVLSTEISPIVRQIARNDMWKEMEADRIRKEMEGPASRRVMKTLFNSLGLDSNSLRRYLDGDLEDVLRTAPAYWATCAYY